MHLFILLFEFCELLKDKCTSDALGKKDIPLYFSMNIFLPTILHTYVFDYYCIDFQSFYISASLKENYRILCEHAYEQMHTSLYTEMYFVCVKCKNS